MAKIKLHMASEIIKPEIIYVKDIIIIAFFIGITEG